MDDKLKFPKKVVQKIEKSSYIINTMESLSQIFNLYQYFLSRDLHDNKNELSSDFKEYMKNLWENDNKIFTPMAFMKKLIKISNAFSCKEELDPYNYYHYILKKLNDELNGKDLKITKDFENLKNKFQNDEYLNKFLEKYIKENNSFISQTFYGIMKITKTCDYCRGNEETEYQKFDIIDIDIFGFCNYMHLEGHSLTNFYLDDCIDYYFDKDKTKEEYPCPTDLCKGKERQKKYDRKLIELPNYLIIRINWGDFENNKGFKCEIKGVKPSYQYLEVDEIIEIKKDYCEDESYNVDKPIEDSIKYKLFSTIDYFINDDEKLIFITKYRIKEKGKTDRWYNFWCNATGKEKGTYIDHFTTPYLLFYEKI